MNRSEMKINANFHDRNLTRENPKGLTHSGNHCLMMPKKIHHEAH
jgi:hypothetical protein